MSIRTKLVMLATAGIFALGAVAPTGAAPITAGSAALKDAVPSDVIDVRHRGGAIAAGIGLGLLGGALIAGAAGPCWGCGYGYGPYYGYGYAPAYYGPPVVYVAPRRRYWRRAYWGPGPYWGGGPYWGARPFYW